MQHLISLIPRILDRCSVLISVTLRYDRETSSFTFLFSEAVCSYKFSTVFNFLFQCFFNHKVILAGRDPYDVATETSKRYLF